jgi:hypothetical protein
MSVAHTLNAIAGQSKEGARVLNFLTLTSAFLVGPIPVDYSAFHNEAAVYGTVLDMYTRQGVPGAIVYAVSADLGVRQTTADRHGRFWFFVLPPGGYRLLATALGHSPSCICCRQPLAQLNAGFEYTATVWLPRACH